MVLAYRGAESSKKLKSMKQAALDKHHSRTLTCMLAIQQATNQGQVTYAPLLCIESSLQPEIGKEQ
jgi:hypothetical protein